MGSTEELDESRAMRRRVPLLFLVSPFMLVGGCVPGARAVRAQAAQELGCPEKDVTVVPLSLSSEPVVGNPDDALYEARGCGKRSEYWVQGRVIRQHHGEWYAPR